MGRTANQVHSREGRLKKLAERIDALAAKDEDAIRRAAEIAAIRRAAAGELHAVCLELVENLNRMLTRAEVVLDPPLYSPEYFRDGAPNLIQINVRGRILQMEFEATPELLSCEEFRIPYTLEGSVRVFNQELLDKDRIEEQLVFYTIEKHRNMWRFFDGRTYRSGPLDEEYLVTLIEQLI